MLPIDLVPNTDPPRFIWQQVVDGRAIDHNGMFPPTVEGAVKRLIELAKKVTAENAVLRGKIAAQSELLLKANSTATSGAVTAPAAPAASPAMAETTVSVAAVVAPVASVVAATAKPMNPAAVKRKG